MKHKRTRALEISKVVKDRVYERDGRRCIYCGSLSGLPEAHYIPRSLSGLGIEENVLTLCRRCHDVFDNGTAPQRQEMRDFFAWYLKGKYLDWNEADLVYRKGTEQC